MQVLLLPGDQANLGWESSQHGDSGQQQKWSILLLLARITGSLTRLAKFSPHLCSTAGSFFSGRVQKPPGPEPDHETFRPAI